MYIIGGCASDKGIRRSKNQDRVLCILGSDQARGFSLGCVCDGIGSFENSEMASADMIQGIKAWYLDVEKLYPERMSAAEVVQNLDKTLTQLNENIFFYRKNYGTDIGCTMSLLMILEENFYIFHVGDSRVYQLEGGQKMIPVTRDEVVLGEATTKSRLSNYIGKRGELFVTRFSGELGENDAFIMGSDGFFDKLIKDDVLAAIAKSKNNKQALSQCQDLLQIMMKRGATDNISCVLLMNKKKSFFDGHRKSAVVYNPQEDSDEDMISMHDSDTFC